MFDLAQDRELVAVDQLAGAQNADIIRQFDARNSGNRQAPGAQQGRPEVNRLGQPFAAAPGRRPAASARVGGPAAATSGLSPRHLCGA